MILKIYFRQKILNHYNYIKKEPVSVIWWFTNLIIHSFLAYYSEDHELKWSNNLWFGTWFLYFLNKWPWTVNLLTSMWSYFLIFKWKLYYLHHRTIERYISQFFIETEPTEGVCILCVLLWLDTEIDDR